MGGKAFEGVTQRINKDDIPETLEWLEGVWPDAALNKVKGLNKVKLGSAGKSVTSGDIDLNLDIEAYDQAKVASQLINVLGSDHVKARPGHNQIFTAIPIKGDPLLGRVQVDFMFGNFEWQEFSYFSPAFDSTSSGSYSYYNAGRNITSSIFKGLYRTEFIKALVAYNSDWVLIEDKEMVARVGPTFFHDRGIVWRYRHRPIRQDGNGRVKALVEITKEEFQALYPSSLEARCDSMIDPRAVADLLFDKNIRMDSFDKLETLVQYTRRYYTQDEFAQIVSIYGERLNSLKVEIPTEKFRYHYIRI